MLSATFACDQGNIQQYKVVDKDAPSLEGATAVDGINSHFLSLYYTKIGA